jgi:glutamine---fructose-6-phosphate transaminase (isomerizing)
MQVLGAHMEREIREQASLISPRLEEWKATAGEAVKGKSFDMVLLAARGSSDNAALYARYLIETILGIPVCLAAPSVLTRYGVKVKYPPCLAIGISQSGAAPDVSEVLADLQRRGHTTIAITNTPNSRLSHSADATLLLGVGEEKSIAATKTYTASIAALIQTVAAMGGDLPDLKTFGSDWVDSSLEAATASLYPVLRLDPIFTLARGYSFCTAHESALKLMECALISCKAYSTADFAHGPQALADAGSAALCFGEVPESLEASGCRVIRAPEPGQGPFDPLWNVVFGQWTALLAARARGLDPDHAQNLNKVTKTL